MFKIVLFCAAICAVFSVNAQYTLTGTVSDEMSLENLPFAKITVKNQPQTAISNENGNFSILVNGTDTLEIAITGYQTQKIAVDNRLQIEVKLNVAFRELNTIVVTALGLKRNKRDLGYSVQKIETGDITAIRNTNVVNTLAGRIAGVQTTNGSSGLALLHVLSFVVKLLCLAIINLYL